MSQDEGGAPTMTEKGGWPWPFRLGKWVVGGVGAAILAAAGTAIYNASVDRLQDPVTVDVTVDPAVLQAGQPNWTPYFYYVPMARTQLTQPPTDCRDRRSWAWEQGGSDADESRARLTLTGGRDGQVSLDAMSVEVVAEEPLERGVVAACPVGGATASVHGLRVDLDRRTVTFVRQDEEVPARFTLSKGETEAFDVYASAFTTPRLIEWRLHLSIVDGDDRRTVTVDDDGQPFRTAGAAAAGTPMVVWRDGAWARYRP